MKKTKVLLLSLVLMVATALFAGCTGFKSQIDVDEKPYRVVIHANGGVMNGMEVRVFYLPAGAPIPKPDALGTIIPQPTYENHDVVGYYEVNIKKTVNENGATLYEIERNDNGEIKWGREWNFATDHLPSTVDESKKDEEGFVEIDLAVQWQRKITYEFTLGSIVGTDGQDVTATETNFKMDKTVIDEDGNVDNSAYIKSVASGNKIEKPYSSNIPTASGYTFMGYYKDKACTEEMVLPYTMTAEEEYAYEVEAEENPNYNFPVYTKWLKGTWTLVDSPKSFTSIESNKNYYFLETGVLDMSEVKGFRIASEYSGTIAGNGCTVKGLHIDIMQEQQKTEYFAMFGELKGAHINDITFEDVTATFTIGVDPDANNNEKNKTADIYSFYKSKDANSSFSNVNFSITLKVEHTRLTGRYLELWQMDEDTGYFKFDENGDRIPLVDEEGKQYMGTDGEPLKDKNNEVVLDEIVIINFYECDVTFHGVDGAPVGEVIKNNSEKQEVSIESTEVK